MNEGEKQAYLDRVAAQIREWGAKIEVIKAKAAKEAAGVRVEYHKNIASWSEKESVLNQKVEALKTASADSYENVKAGVQGVWTELTNLFKSIEGNK